MDVIIEQEAPAKPVTIFVTAQKLPGREGPKIKNAQSRESGWARVTPAK